MKMNKKLQVFGIITIFLLTIFTLSPVMGIKISEVSSRMDANREIQKNDEASPGEIIAISF